MKKYSLLFTIFFIYSCGNNSNKEQAVENDTTDIAKNIYHWEATLNDTSGLLEIKKMEAVGPDSLSPAAVVDFINKDNTNIHLQLVKTSNDTVYLKIADAAPLTQQMGSTGPTIYMAEVVYNLTTIPGISYVTFDFEEGDHAAPGTFNRESYKDK